MQNCTHSALNLCKQFTKIENNYYNAGIDPSDKSSFTSWAPPKNINVSEFCGDFGNNTVVKTKTQVPYLLFI